MDTRDLYVMDENGILRVGTGARLIFVPALLSVGLAELASLTFSSSTIAVSVALILLSSLLFDGYRSRRLRNLLALPRGELEARASSLIPWSSVLQMSVKGRTLTFVTSSKRSSIALDNSEVPLLVGKASASLGARFVQVPSRSSPRISPSWKFLLLTLALFALTQVIIAWASISPFFSGEQEHYTTVYNSMQDTLSGASIIQQFGLIFLNNVQVALIGFIPGIGPLFLSLAGYNTGRVIQVIAVQEQVPASYLLLVLFVLPHAWVEELSYPLAGALGLYAVIQWRRQSYSEFANWRSRASTKIAVGFAGITLILVLAAILEVVEPGLSYGALLLWIPIIAGGVYVYFKLRSRIAAWLS